MTDFTDDELRVIRAMRKAMEIAEQDIYPLEPGVWKEPQMEAARLYAGMKAFFENVQVDQASMAASSAKVFTPAARGDR